VPKTQTHGRMIPSSTNSPPAESISDSTKNVEVYWISTFLVLSLVDSAGGLLVLDGIIRLGVCVLGTDVVY
jgi:hypothetical protein